MGWQMNVGLQVQQVGLRWENPAIRYPVESYTLSHILSLREVTVYSFHALGLWV